MSLDPSSASQLNLDPGVPSVRCVFDSQVALDLWLFLDPRVEPLRAALQAGHLRPWGSALLRDELAHVLSLAMAAKADGAPSSPGAALRRWLNQRLGPEPARVAQACAEALGAWDRWTRLMPHPAAPASPLGPRCTDPDDQKFIDLSVHAAAALPASLPASPLWLFSRDRAVLKLARRLRPLGVEAIAPERWAAR